MSTNLHPEFLLDRLSANARRLPKKTAIVFLEPGPSGGKVHSQYTYQTLEQVTTDLARRLLDRGLAHGDRALLVYPPSLEFMVAFLACLKAGVVAVPVFPPNPVRRDTLFMFSKIAESSGAQFALTSTEYNHLKKMAGLKDAFGRFFQKRGTAQWPEQLEWITTNNTAGKNATARSELPTPAITSTSLAFLQYTSGSTSEPKGVMITHGNLGHNLTIITAELKATDDAIVASWLPQYHDMGLIGSYLGILYCGGTGYYMSPLSFLQRPMLWIEAISKYKATHLQAPNFAFKLTARKYTTSSNDALDLSSVRHVINAAEPVDQDSIDTFMKVFAKHGFGNVIFPTYGLAEHTVFVCSGGTQRLSVLKQQLEVDGKAIVVPEDKNKKNGDDGDDGGADTGEISRLVGCGYPARQGVDLCIVNTDTFVELAEDSVGEIWVNSPSKAAGYFQNPEATKADFHAQIAKLKDGTEPSHEDGFLRTGDLGFLHKGEVFICGRLKDLIIVGGRNYYPQDIEATAEAASDLIRPGCSAAFTIDPTKQGGEEVAIVMELREVPKDVASTCISLAEQIRAAINQEHSLGISEICFLSPKTVPKTTSGKIARAWCRKGFVGNTLKVVYRKSLKNNNDQKFAPLEVELTSPSQSRLSVQEIRALDKESILSRLKVDLSRVGEQGIPPETIRNDAAIVTILDSMSISQFKGMLEGGYGVKLSDEYLFRENCTLVKLAEVIQLGYAPDDGDGEGVAVAHSGPQQEGTAGGLAGALGCPPGVVCVIL